MKRKLVPFVVLLLALYGLLSLVTRVALSPSSEYRNLSPFVWLFDSPVYAGYIPTPVKSVQQVSVSVAAAAITGSATITAVVTGNSLIVYQGIFTDDSGNAFGCQDWMIGAFSSTTTITATKGSTCSTFNNNYKAVVIEFLGNFVKSSGNGVIAIADGSTSNTAPITSVNTAKMAVAYTGQKNNTAALTTAREDFVTVSWTNATTITAARGATSSNLNNLNAGYNYVEFK